MRSDIDTALCASSVAKATLAPPPFSRGTVLNTALAALVVMAVALAAYVMKTKSPLIDKAAEPDYAALVPESFAGWRLVPQIRLVTPVEDDALANRIYSQMIGRAYVDNDGNTVMLLIAYGPRQIDRLQLHRPEICYIAEGFRVSGLTPFSAAILPDGGVLPLSKLVARREGRVERITYWMRIGDDVVSTLFRRQLTTLGYGLRGVIADGVLVRVSSINVDADTADEVHQRFLRDMLAAVDKGQLKQFIGS
jgi:EpsI family protein